MNSPSYPSSSEFICGSNQVFRGRAMDDGDPWVLLEHLEGDPRMPQSGRRWRAVLRPCCGMIPALSDHDLSCLVASDEYAAGRLGPERLAALRAETWARLPWGGGGRLTARLYAARAACGLLFTDEEIGENWFHWA